jgi:hypothetical protein
MGLMVAHLMPMTMMFETFKLAMLMTAVMTVIYAEPGHFKSF